MANKNKSAAKNRAKNVAVQKRSGLSPALIAGIVVVVLFAAAVGFGLYYSNQSKIAADAAVPAGAVAAGGDQNGILVGNASAAKTMDIYLDFQCPVCKAYETQMGPTIDAAVAQGKVKVIYHPLAFLDRFSSTQYSTRSSEAAACVSETPGAFPAYVKLLYGNQPPENGNGLPDSQLVSLATQAGAPATVADCINNHTYSGWTARITDAASKANVTGTPTVMVDGKVIENTQQALTAALA
jgi:protein-disulfide isomerase